MLGAPSERSASSAREGALHIWYLGAAFFFRKCELTARSVGRLCTVLGVAIDVLDQDGLQGKEQKYVMR